MTFFSNEPARQLNALGLSSLLAQGLVASGIPVKPGAAKRWEPDVARLLRTYSVEQVLEVITYMSARHRDQYTPLVRSGVGLREKFDRLLALTGEVYRGKQASPEVCAIIQDAPLQWPFPSANEPAWLQASLESLGPWLADADESLYHYLGPPSHCLALWRYRTNALTWGLGIDSFARITWREDDMAWTDILRGHHA